jgi:hypothetical protein
MALGVHGVVAIGPTAALVDYTGFKLGTGCLGGGHPVLDMYIYVHNLTACKLSGASISFPHPWDSAALPGLVECIFS